MATDPWHYPRRDLAERTLNLLANGPGQALVLFAPRRTGKTEFLLKDLGPLADRNGHRVIYASFWQAPLAPLAVLLHALEISHRQGSFSDRVRSTALALTPKLKLSAPVPGATAESEIDLTQLAGKPPSELLLYLDMLFDQLADPARPTVLLLDEVQELARNDDNGPLVSALRTSLDKRSDGLKVVFTGSSREGLKAMFAAREAPFFHFATPIDLPPLGEGFVDHLLVLFDKTANRSLDRAEALDAFRRLHGNPYFFRSLLELLLLNSGLELADALHDVRDRIASQLGYPETWLSLSPIQRAIVNGLADGLQKPFSQPARDQFGRLLGETAPSAARVQAAIRKLENLELVDRYGGTWRLDDPEFANWVRDRGRNGQ